jgi:hypothetical protein
MVTLVNGSFGGRAAAFVRARQLGREMARGGVAVTKSRSACHVS